jgi:diacylglycerol kinase (ATP)
LNAPLLAIVNPVAGRGRAARAWPRLAAALAAAGVAVECVVTRLAGEASGVAARAHADGPRTVLAVGGDGTLNEVLNGLLQAGGRATLAVAPYGTGNDWAHFLGVPGSPRTLAVVLARGRTRAVDVGLLEYAAEGRRETRHFINVAGSGYDAFVLERLSRRGPRALAYLAALAGGLVHYRAPRFTVRAAGATDAAIEGRLFVAFAMLGRSCGGGMRFAPRARPDDGLLDLVTIEQLAPLAALARLSRVYAGSILEDAAVRFRQCAEVSIEAEPAARVEADGQLLGHTPARARVLPGAIDFVVP